MQQFLHCSCKVPSRWADMAMACAACSIAGYFHDHGMGHVHGSGHLTGDSCQNQLTLISACKQSTNSHLKLWLRRSLARSLNDRLVCVAITNHAPMKIYQCRREFTDLVGVIPLSGRSCRPRPSSRIHDLWSCLQPIVAEWTIIIKVSRLKRLSKDV